MKKTNWLLLLLLPLLSAAQQTGIHFEQNLSWAQIKAKAKAENKYIFMDCYTTWCGPCKMMDHDVYPDPKVSEVVNAKFISVKVQMDKTAKDDAQTQSWYGDADRLQKEGYVTAYPSFLFFTSEGKMVYSEIGYRGPEQFIKVAQSALDPEKARYYTRVDEYRKGIKDYPTLGGLAIWTKTVMKDTALTRRMAEDYKINYFDKLTPAEVCTKANLDFAANYYELLNSKDPVFDVVYHQPQRADSVKNWPGWSKIVVGIVVTREELEDKTIKSGKPTFKKPNWLKLQETISWKYPDVDSRKLVMDFELRNYYLYIDKDWQKWAEVKDAQIKAYPPQQKSNDPKNKYSLQDVYVNINGWEGAWLVFARCNDKQVLAKALEWADLAIKLDGERAAYLDTKANLLYKLGRKAEAIALEQKALDQFPKSEDYAQALEDMKNDRPTYVNSNDQAIWTANTLPKKL